MQLLSQVLNNTYLTEEQNLFYRDFNYRSPFGLFSDSGELWGNIKWSMSFCIMKSKNLKFTFTFSCKSLTWIFYHIATIFYISNTLTLWQPESQKPKTTFQIQICSFPTEWTVNKSSSQSILFRHEYTAAKCDCGWNWRQSHTQHTWCSVPECMLAILHSFIVTQARDFQVI